VKTGQPTTKLLVLLTACIVGLVIGVGGPGCGRPGHGFDPADEAGAGAWEGATDAGPDVASDRRGTTGEIPIPKSCVGLPATCGPKGNEDCCATILVPGGTYNRSNNGLSPATVGDFWLDKYEITVGRFRKFVEAGGGTWASAPAVGDGAHPWIVGSGWSSQWDTQLAKDAASLRGGLSYCYLDGGHKPIGVYKTWTDAPGENENRPMNCIDWHQAFAFCAWDGGWLPTEAEWNYAAAGGSEQRPYSWGSAEPGADVNLAVFGCYYPTGSGECTGVENVAFVGSSPAGNGRWGHADLMGNLSEWVLDGSPDPTYVYPMPCNDCATLVNARYRICRGGSFDKSAPWLGSDGRYYPPCTNGYIRNDASVGARCGRTP